jgi:hypothetical protein
MSYPGILPSTAFNSIRVSATELFSLDGSDVKGNRRHFHFSTWDEARQNVVDLILDHVPAHFRTKWTVSRH